MIQIRVNWLCLSAFLPTSTSVLHCKRGKEKEERCKELGTHSCRFFLSTAKQYTTMSSSSWTIFYRIRPAVCAVTIRRGGCRYSDDQRARQTVGSSPIIPSSGSKETHIDFESVPEEGYESECQQFSLLSAIIIRFNHWFLMYVNIHFKWMNNNDFKYMDCVRKFGYDGAIKVSCR